MLPVIVNLEIRGAQEKYLVALAPLLMTDLAPSLPKKRCFDVVSQV